MSESGFVEMRIIIDGEVVDTYLFGDGEEAECEQRQEGVAEVGKRITTAHIGYSVQWHDHALPDFVGQVADYDCDCATTHGTTEWSNFTTV